MASSPNVAASPNTNAKGGAVDVAANLATAAVGDKRFTGSHDIVSWAMDLIATINAQSKGRYHIPTNAVTVGILVTWANHESGGYNPSSAGGRNNPLNTTEKSQGGVAGQGGSQGNIVDFSTYADGLRNQAHNLLSPSFGYPAILAGLSAASPAKTFAAINASGFGTHFGANTPVAGVTTSGTGKAAGGSAGQTATETGVDLNPFDAVKSIIGIIPGVGTIESGAKTYSALAAIAIGVFANWRYVVEVFAGVGLIAVGLLLIAVDTGAAKKATSGVKTAAEIGAVAA